MSAAFASRQSFKQRLEQDYNDILRMGGGLGGDNGAMSPMVSSLIALVVAAAIIALGARMLKKSGKTTLTAVLVGGIAVGVAVYAYKKKTCASCVL